MVPTLVEQHASEAAFLWGVREVAAGASHYSLADLAHLDARVEAHLDGLRIAGPEALAVTQAAAAAGERGAVFVAAAHALHTGDAPAFADILDRYAGAPEMDREIVGALAWVAPRRVAWALAALLHPRAPAKLRRFGVLAHAAHGSDPGPALGRALEDDDLATRRAAIEAAGRLGRVDLLAPIVRFMDEGSAEVRAAAAWTGTLLGEPRAAEVALDLARGQGAWAVVVAEVGLRRRPADAGAWIAALASRPERARDVVFAIELSADPAHLPRLVELMREPALARLAGQAFSSLTGIPLEGALRGQEPAGFSSGPSDDPDDADVSPDPDDHLPWPAPDAVAAWVAELSREMPPGTRRLLGRPVSIESCRAALRCGSQRARGAAAIELSLLAPGTPLSAVRAPGFRQIS